MICTRAPERCTHVWAEYGQSLGWGSGPFVHASTCTRVCAPGCACTPRCGGCAEACWRPTPKGATGMAAAPQHGPTSLPTHTVRFHSREHAHIHTAYAGTPCSPPSLQASSRPDPHRSEACCAPTSLSAGSGQHRPGAVGHTQPSPAGCAGHNSWMACIAIANQSCPKCVHMPCITRRRRRARFRVVQYV